MRDVWLNWVEGAIREYDVPEFQSWRKDDAIDLMDTVPVLKVNPKTYDYIADGVRELPDTLLDMVRGKALRRTNNVRIDMDCFIIHDGNRSMAIDDLGLAFPAKKSQLIPRQEELIRECMEFRDVVEFELLEIKEDDEPDTIDPKHMVGLTRTEKEKKRLLHDALLIVQDQEDKLSMLKYWYSEWDYKSYKSLDEISFDELYKRLMDEVVASGWSDRHENFLAIVVKESPYFESVFEEMKERGKRVG